MSDFRLGGFLTEHKEGDVSTFRKQWESAGVGLGFKQGTGALPQAVFELNELPTLLNPRKQASFATGLESLITDVQSRYPKQRWWVIALLMYGYAFKVNRKNMAENEIMFNTMTVRGKRITADDAAYLASAYPLEGIAQAVAHGFTVDTHLLLNKIKNQELSFTKALLMEQMDVPDAQRKQAAQLPTFLLDDLYGL